MSITADHWALVSFYENPTPQELDIHVSQSNLFYDSSFQILQYLFFLRSPFFFILYTHASRPLSLPRFALSQVKTSWKVCQETLGKMMYWIAKQRSMLFSRAVLFARTRFLLWGEATADFCCATSLPDILNYFLLRLHVIPSSTCGQTT